MSAVIIEFPRRPVREVARPFPAWLTMDTAETDEERDLLWAEVKRLVAAPDFGEEEDCA